MPETTFKISVIPDLLIFKGQTKLIAKLQILNKHNTIKPQTVFGTLFRFHDDFLSDKVRLGCITTAPWSFIYVSHIPLIFAPRKRAIWNHWTPNYSYPWKVEVRQQRILISATRQELRRLLRGHSQDWWSIKRESNCHSALKNSRQLHTRVLLPLHPAWLIPPSLVFLSIIRSDIT